MKYILLWMVASGTITIERPILANVAPTSGAADFDSKEACEAARPRIYDITKDATGPKGIEMPQVVSVCVPKNK